MSNQLCRKTELKPIMAHLLGASVIILVFCVMIDKCTADWQLVWEDQFEGGNLSERYNFETGCNGWGNNELQCYTSNRPENALQDNGTLIISAIKEKWGDGVNPDKQFTSTRMATKCSFLYGKFEMRARLPNGKHLWPAFWMMPAASEYGDWPRSGEIDIMEYRGQQPNVTLGTLHFGESKDKKGQVGSPETEFPVDFSEEFHIFGINWSSTKIMWLVDDQVYHEESLQENFWESLYTQRGQPFDKNFYMIINLAVGGNFFGDEPFDPVEAEGWLKPTFEIDWIRKWEWLSKNSTKISK